MMLKIAALLLSANVVLVLSQCKVHPQIHDFDYNKATGTWYWHFHSKNDVEKGFGCLKNVFNPADDSGTSKFTLYYSDEDGNVGQYTGTLAADETGMDNQFPNSPAWETKYHVLSTDYDNYLITTGCLKGENAPTVWVGFRKPQPNKKPLEKAKEALEKFGIELSSLTEFTHPDKC